jgi:hypothetical protein
MVTKYTHFCHGTYDEVYKVYQRYDEAMHRQTPVVFDNKSCMVSTIDCDFENSKSSNIKVYLISVE